MQADCRLRERRVQRPTAQAIVGTLAALAFAMWACNAPLEQPDTEATVQAIYLTITAQAGTAIAPTVSASGSPAAATPTPTVGTPPPTLTPTPPQERSGNGANFTIGRCAGSMAIDSNGSDWAAQVGAVRFMLDTATFGAANWSGVADASAEARACWTAEALYLFLIVTDDLHVQTQQGATQWQGDEAELLFDNDLYGDFYRDRWDDDDVQIGLSAGNFGDLAPAAVRYHPTVEALGSVSIGVWRMSEAGGNYVMEVAIPWAVLGVAPQEGARYGFCLALSDNDQPDQASQDTMVSHCTRLRVIDPTTWVTVLLAP